MSEPPISTINVSSNLHAGDDTDSHFVGLNMADIMGKLGGQIKILCRQNSVFSVDMS